MSRIPVPGEMLERIALLIILNQEETDNDDNPTNV